MKRLVIVRRSSQLFFLLLFIYILWSTTYPLTGFFPAGTFFKFDPLIMFMTSIAARVVIPGLLFSVSILVISLIFGRFFCGWACPLGTLIDAAGGLRKKYPVKQDAVNRLYRKTKFYILGVIIITAVAGMQIAWVFDPMVIMGRFVSLNLIPTVTFAADSVFIFIMRDLGIRGVVQDIYRAIEPTFLGVQIHYFSHSLIIFLFLVIIAGLSLIKKRLWCRAICPLGAFYAPVSRNALLKRTYKGCTSCGICKSECRMGAIRDDLSYAQGECILCMDCVYDCPGHFTKFRFQKTDTKFDPAYSGTKYKGISRKSFLWILVSSFLATGFRSRSVMRPGGERPVIRPPAALKEAEFLNRCIRCGNCMKVCITNGLQPAFLESGLSGIWTPVLMPDIGYCENRCTLCGHTCPTGAIPPLSLERKVRVRLGLARVNRSICLPWAEGKECIVCQEHCPIPDKAIKVEKELTSQGIALYKPYVDKDLCVGCGICQTKCPVRPTRAIRVFPVDYDRT